MAEDIKRNQLGSRLIPKLEAGTRSNSCSERDGVDMGFYQPAHQVPGDAEGECLDCFRQRIGGGG